MTWPEMCLLSSSFYVQHVFVSRRKPFPAQSVNLVRSVYELSHIELKRVDTNVRKTEIPASAAPSAVSLN